MTDPQRRAVEALTKIGVNWEEVDEEQANYILTALREANLIILDRETVAAAVAVAKSFTPRWSEYDCFKEMEEVLRDG